MSKEIDIISVILSESKRDMYLRCEPVVNGVPNDMKELNNIPDSMWKAKIYVKDDCDIVPISEWFTINCQNIRDVINGKVTDISYIRLTGLPDSEIKSLFENTRPAFKLDGNMSRDDMYWISRYVKN